MTAKKTTTKAAPKRAAPNQTTAEQTTDGAPVITQEADLAQLRKDAEHAGKQRAKLDDVDADGRPLPPTEASTINLESKPETAVAPPAQPISVDGSPLPPPAHEVAVAPPAPPHGLPLPVQDERDTHDKAGLRLQIAEKTVNE